MDLIVQRNNVPTTTSLLVAKKFDKGHNDVLRAIRNLECSDEFRARNFALSSYSSTQNKEMPLYYMNRDGFTLLVMSFTGSMSARFKEEYIEQFNKMETYLRTQTLQPLLTYSRRILSEPTKGVPKGYWSVFDKCHKIMFLIEKHVGCISKYDLVDGSIGIRWAAFRKEQEWITGLKFYPHKYEDTRGTVKCNCYHRLELEHFEEWLEEVYRKIHLIEYLRKKFKDEKNNLFLDKLEENMQKLIE